MPVSLCLCTVIEIRRRTKSLDLVLCTVVYIVKPGGAIGLGKTSITIWTISSLKIVEIIGGNELYLDHSGPHG